MTYCKIVHWNPVEESRDSTTFEGSLQSKMSKNNFDHDFWDMLIVMKSIDFFNTMKVTSAVFKEEMIKKLVSFAEIFKNLNNIAELGGALFR